MSAWKCSIELVTRLCIGREQKLGPSDRSNVAGANSTIKRDLRVGYV